MELYFLIYYKLILKFTIHILVCLSTLMIWLLPAFCTKVEVRGTEINK